jgi:MoaA/NifB/PqqE/SkfB family radical SAM enzyme
MLSSNKNALKALVLPIIRNITIPPILVNLEVSKACNLGCKHCRRWASSSLAQNNKDQLNLTPTGLGLILSKIPSIREVNYIGEGEPLMNPYFRDLIRLASLKGLNTSFTTNGTLITPQDVDYWAAHKVSRISISLDSPIKETFEVLRPGADFKRVIESAGLIKASGIYLQLNLVLYQERMNEIEAFIELAHSVGANRIDLIRPHYIGSNGPYTYPENTLDNRLLLLKNKRLTESYKLLWYEPWFLGPYFRQCNSPFVGPYIHINGDIQVCCFMMGLDRTEFYMNKPFSIPASKYIVGNIYKDNFWKVWYGQSYRNVRRIIRQTDTKVGTSIDLKELLRLKETLELEPWYNQCKVCQWRWGTAC